MDWAKHGVKIIRSDELDANTPQTSGMTRAAAITYAGAGANKLWAGTMVVQPEAKTGRITMESWKPCFTWWRAEFECGGAINWS